LTNYKAGVKRRVDFALPRGVLVRGRVVEEKSGRPVAGAIAYHYPRLARGKSYGELEIGWLNPVVSDGSGRFQIAVLPGPGYLVVEGPGPEYVPRVLGQNQLIHHGKPGGGRWYAHAFVPLNFKAKSGPQEITVRLRRGVKVRGKVVGLDGKPPARVRMFTRLSTSARQTMKLNDKLAVIGEVVPPAGFQLPGCDPHRAYPVVFLDEKNQAGALVACGGRSSVRKPLTVRLSRCGAATVCFRDETGKPLAGFQPVVEMVLAPGPSSQDWKAWERGTLAADATTLTNLQQPYRRIAPSADARGRCTLPALVPGATYRLRWEEKGRVVVRDFIVKSGTTRDLGDITIKGKK
jgi:hypothetical protein